MESLRNGPDNSTDTSAPPGAERNFAVAIPKGAPRAGLTLSLVIPVHNGGEPFARCLNAVAALEPGPDEVIVVADGCTDDSAGVALERGCSIVTLARRMGPAAARNEGARAAGGGILFFVDSDVALPRDAVRQVLAAFAGEPQVAALFGSYDDEPAAEGFLSQYKNLMHHYVHQTSSEDAWTFWGACGAIRRDVFFSVGGFDESFTKPSIEDIELGYRLRAVGSRIRLVKSLQVKHLKRWTLVSLVATDFLRRALPWSRLILERGLPANDLNLKVGARVSVVLVYALVACLVLAAWRPWLLAIAAAWALLLLGANGGVYGFFLRKRGMVFTAGAICWHWFYYLYGGAAFAAAAVLHCFKAGLRRSRRLVRKKPVAKTDCGTT